MSSTTVIRIPALDTREHAREHDWSLRDVDFEDAHMGGVGVRRFECVSCGAVRFD